MDKVQILSLIHGCCSHLFQRVASFLPKFLFEFLLVLNSQFSSLSESGFIPTHPLYIVCNQTQTKFSSLSESGFIPTLDWRIARTSRDNVVLISFREWLHSYEMFMSCSVVNFSPVLISFREWLHSYNMNKGKIISLIQGTFSSLSESGFIPTYRRWDWAGLFGWNVLISFREWLHSYIVNFCSNCW